MKHFVLNNLKGKIEEGTYHICLDEECDMVYFNLEKGIELKKEKMKIPNPLSKCCSPAIESTIEKALNIENEFSY